MFNVKKKIQAHKINIHKSKRTYLCDAFFSLKQRMKPVLIQSIVYIYFKLAYLTLK